MCHSLVPSLGIDVWGLGLRWDDDAGKSRTVCLGCECRCLRRIKGLVGVKDELVVSCFLILFCCIGSSINYQLILGVRLDREGLLVCSRFVTFQASTIIGI